MATIKAIEARSVHQIQSGQVIVDLCSVVKELVENSLDAGATSIEVRFKNNGLDLIEVQDNGAGISPENYENVALKHHTSKLSSFEDLSRLHTFGFRGEALSSLCALSEFRIVTAQANQAPKATKLEFEMSGKLSKTQVVAGQKGTTASVEGLFKRLPVRRRELEKNIKREYTKVLNLLHAYACVSTGVRFSVRNTMGKNRNAVVFSTNDNQTTKDNIANVYGAKTLLALIPLDLVLEFEPSAAARRTAGGVPNKILVKGHISRPVFGEGRQTPDRQMFFVNARPCGLPQIAKAFNEVYKSFNVSQSPFVFADFNMDTNAYDVNVSPDKRTILLHDAGALIDALKQSLTELFETSDQTVPQSQVAGQRQPAPKQQVGILQVSTPAKRLNDGDGTAGKEPQGHEDEEEEEEEEEVESSQPNSQAKLKSLLRNLGAGREPANLTSPVPADELAQQKTASVASPAGRGEPSSDTVDNELFVPEHGTPSRASSIISERISRGAVAGGNEPARNTAVPSTPQDIPELQERSSPVIQAGQSETPNVIQNAFDRMRPRRMPAEVATITIGSKTVTSMVGTGIPRKRNGGSIDSSGGSLGRKKRIHTPSRPNIFGKHMRAFAAPGSQLEEPTSSEEEIEGDEEEEEVEEAEVGLGEDIMDCDSDGSQSYCPSDHEDDRSPDDINHEMAPAEEPNESEGLTESLDDEEKKKHEEAEVQRLIREAEAKAIVPQENSINRANRLSKGAAHRDSTTRLASTIDGSLSRIVSQMTRVQDGLRAYARGADYTEDEREATPAGTAEERLSLTVTKDDFARMRIIGQFNLGFILATRSPEGSSSETKDELFIIDQHASDEKFNFERLQAETVVQNQRLVQSKRLDLTAVEEEIVIENQFALEKNGFVVEVDDSGDEPIGQRCKLVSLPLSKEVVFGMRDLEELIVLLSEMPATTSARSAAPSNIPRPSKVRKMFAMRACRSSIMIGKNLTQKQMVRVVRNMGTIDKPWNCPHGRPTMRHLMTLGQWSEWDEFGPGDEDGGECAGRTEANRLDVWRNYFQEMDEMSAEEEEEGEGDDSEA
ncbi:ATP-binding mismatch repair protein PMS1 [Aspergillus clavatus NRRL 1]|uniref:DNA mismatch repair protein PMS1 n=1 Tax=Aspergillus clavatus (strain ATCC 1007 / CBS 513.65 / DSM 816 / NCTC 3887 / NRRL 1 / QM 1276 / 107) TaxID=344612 RepID=A1C718_ASPCL|nr:DNA mismatch repair protein (Pms1), putative [Aspergillus clavatus NRRL 1]EAW14189.1 DNA mismatch repair protein (Pms1), putative [Aspergillus clavatus NRRL 1]